MQLALDEGSVSVTELASRFDVSEVTIRTDLNLMDKRSLLTRRRGGAVASAKLLKEFSISDKEREKADAKRRLAERAAGFISDGDTVILDAGSTTAEIAKCIPPLKRLQILTNGLNVAYQLANLDTVDVMLTGGMLRKKSRSFFGAHAEESLINRRFDTLFLGVDGFDFVAGLTTHFEPEAMLNRRMVEAAQQVIVVTDSSKFNRSGLHKICDLGDIDILVTDSGIPNKMADALTARGVQLSIVEI